MPAEFWSLTPREFILQMRGYRWRAEQEMYRTAHLIAALSNPIATYQVNPKKMRGKKRTTADDVMGYKRKRRTARRPEEQLQVFRTLTRGLGGTIKTANPS